MTHLDLIISYRKGEALVNLRNDAFEEIKLVFHAGALDLLSEALHFGLKPGHLFVYAKRWGETQGRWLLRDAGYLNYFRGDKTTVVLTEYNTLAKQKLWSKGRLLTQKKTGEVHLVSRSILPFHRRRVVLRYDDHSVTVDVHDTYLGYCRVYWNWHNRREVTRGWFRQRRTIEL